MSIIMISVLIVLLPFGPAYIIIVSIEKIIELIEKILIDHYDYILIFIGMNNEDSFRNAKEYMDEVINRQ